jgi:hypothetical protein
VDGNFYAVTPEGREKWRLHTGGIRSSSPALDAKGAIVSTTVGAVPDKFERLQKAVDTVLGRP